MTFLFADIGGALGNLDSADWLDLGVLLTILACTLLGAFRGFSGEIAGLVTLMAALCGGIYLHRWIFNKTGGFSELTNDTSMTTALVFAALTLLLILGMFILRRLLRGFIRLVVDQPADSLLGSTVGSARGAVMVLIVFTVVAMSPRDDLRRLFLDESRSGKLLSSVIPRILPHLKRIRTPEEGKEARPREDATSKNDSTPP